MMGKILWGLGILALIPVVLLLVYPRPVDHTPAWVFEGDASLLDYCDLPILDGSGRLAADIPQGHTPGCGYEQFPQPILKYCTEPLTLGATDLRGLWFQEDGLQEDGLQEGESQPDRQRARHLERIEQCGNRVVITTSGVIHDMTTDGSLAGASDDVRPLKLGPLELCIRTSATTEWHAGRLAFYALGGPQVVSRHLNESGELLWEYPSRGTVRMKRICRLPRAFAPLTQRKQP